MSKDLAALTVVCSPLLKPSMLCRNRFTPTHGLKGDFCSLTLAPVDADADPNRGEELLGVLAGE